MWRWGAGDGTDDFDAFFLEHAVRQMARIAGVRRVRRADRAGGRDGRPFVTDARVNRQG
jgi:hypothetical protein